LPLSGANHVMIMSKSPNFELMGIRRRINTANDNVPLQQAERYASSRAEFISANNIIEHPSPKPKIIIPNAPKMPHAVSEYTANLKTTDSLKISSFIWTAVMVMTFAVFALKLSTAPKILATLGLCWTGLWNSYVSADHGRWRTSELSIVSAISGFMAALILGANHFGVGVTLSDGLMLMSVLPLVLGKILKSRISILTSICATLLWAILSFTDFVETSRLMLLFPVIFAAQIYLGTKINSGLAIILSVITAYYWLASFVIAYWGSDDLPLTFASALLFTIGVAHHRLGKASEDTKLTGSSVHIYVGWIAAIIGALGFQYFWLDPNALATSTATLNVQGLALWKAAIIISLAGVFISGIIRYKHSQITRMGILLLTLVSSLIPMMLWFPQWPQNIAANIVGLSAVPSLGIFIGAAICATAIGMALNGVRRHSHWMVAMALITLVIEAFLMVKPHLITLDNIVIFATGMIIALVTSGAIAGSSLTHQASAPRFKHS